MILANLGILISICGAQYGLKKRRIIPNNIQINTDPDKIASQESARQAKLGVASMVLASGGTFIYPPLSLISAGIISYNLYPIFRHTINTWRDTKQITNDSYVSITSLLLLGSSNYFAAGMQGMVYHLSSHYVSKSRKNATQWVTDAYQKAPSQVWRLNADNLEQRVPLDTIEIGDAIIVNTGETIPVDGQIKTGMALVDQQALTGEANPSEKTVGDSVLAATVILRGRIVLTASHNGHDNRIQKLNTLLQQTRDYKTALQLKGEQWADQLALPIMIGSLLSIPVLGVSPALALLFSAPLNIIRAMLSVQTATHLSWIVEQGAFIKDGRVFETLPNIDTIVFDKTGTLTETMPEVAAIISCTERTTEQLLGYAAAAEQRLEHPIAQAIIAKAEAEGISLPTVTDSQYDLGLGIKVQIDQHQVQVGSLRYILQATQSTAAELPTTITDATQAAAGHTFILIAIDGSLAGMLELRPQLRPEVTALLAKLRQRNINQLAVLSGDQQAPTERLAKHLALDAAYGDVMPQEKAEKIKQLQAEGRQVCFIGDGLNDAIAMKQANVSISFNSAAPIASETAQIVLTQDTLAPIDTLFTLSEQLHRRLGKNLSLWIGFGLTNALAVPLLGFGPVQSSMMYLAVYGIGIKHSQRIPRAETQ